MASIQKRTKKGNYYAFYRDHRGKRACRCTGTDVREIAQKIALHFENASTETRHGTFTAEKAQAILNDIMKMNAR